MKTNSFYQVWAIIIVLLLFIPNVFFAQGLKTFGGKADARILTIHDGPGEDDAKVHIGHQHFEPSINDYNLYVEDGILSESVKVANPTSWSDFVFDKSYQLKDLSEVETFIKANHHLPDVPSEKQIIEQGYYDQHEINKTLLQKIEELTLYIIEQKKEIEVIKKKHN